MSGRYAGGIMRNVRLERREVAPRGRGGDAGIVTCVKNDRREQSVRAADTFPAFGDVASRNATRKRN